MVTPAFHTSLVCCLSKRNVSFYAKCMKQRFVIAHELLYVPLSDTITLFARIMPKVPKVPLPGWRWYLKTALPARHLRRDGRKKA